LDKLGQDLRLDELEIQQVLGQEAPGLFLAVQSRGQFFRGQHLSFKEAFSQIHWGFSLSRSARAFDEWGHSRGRGAPRPPDAGGAFTSGSLQRQILKLCREYGGGLIK
jgi:hypothetical protein